MKGNVIKFKKGESSMISWIKKRPKMNKNLIASYFGETGNGKSMALLYTSWKIDPEFNPKQQVAFRFVELMRIINNFNDKNHPLSKKEYKIIGFDDCQTEISAREWQSKINRIFNYLISTFRHQNFILLMSSPYADFLDSSSMKLMHLQFECKGWNKKTKKSKLRPLFLEYNSRQKKFYYHSLFVLRKSKLKKMINWIIGLPPQEMIDNYEECKNKFTQELNAKITRELEEMEHEKDTRKELTEAQRKVMLCIAEHKGNMKEVAKKLDISLATVYDHKNLSKKKGYTWQEMEYP